MNIGIQTWGSDGDINPFIALAGGLAAAGHRVTLAVTSAERKDYCHYAERLGFRLITVGFIGQDESDLVRLAGRMHAAKNPLDQLDVILTDMFEPGCGLMYEAARSLCAENDLVIGHFILHPLQAAAEKARKPYLTVTLNQCAIPSCYAPPTGFPDMGKWLNGIVWNLGMKILNRHILPPINRLRLKEGLIPVNTFRSIWESPLCNLIAVSTEFCPPRPDWGANQHVCGFFSMPEKARPWNVPDDLEKFLKSGPPPVYITFGSMLGAGQDRKYLTETTSLFLEAVRAARCRAIIQSRWDELVDIREDKEIYRIGEAAHRKIFPRCAAVVHHGGAGTTQTATLCGCPSVVVAHISDQYFWGRELRRLGVAPKVLDRRKVTPAILGREIRHVLDTPTMAERAKKLSLILGAENGIATAVTLIEQIISGY
jgi:sterol 3beta-glucosyltransferase